MRALVKELLQTPLPLGELVVDLPDVHRLQVGVAVAGVGLADVHKQVLVELGKGRDGEGSGMDTGRWFLHIDRTDYYVKLKIDSFIECMLQEWSDFTV